MMSRILRVLLFFVVCSGALIASVELANATAFAGVQKAEWSISLAGGSVPDGIVLSCFGTSSGDSSSCADSETLTVTSNHHGLVTDSLSVSGGLEITNTTDESFAGSLHFQDDFSAFNPGGSEIGASVNDLSSEYAFFFSTLTTPISGDFHSCDTRFDQLTEDPPGTFWCGVDSPDSSQTDLFVSFPGPGQSIFLEYAIDIQAAAFSAPEPETSILMVSGLGLLLLASRRNFARKTE
jgi:hypothetical protein